MVVGRLRREYGGYTTGPRYLLSVPIYLGFVPQKTIQVLVYGEMGKCRLHYQLFSAFQCRHRFVGQDESQVPRIAHILPPDDLASKIRKYRNRQAYQAELVAIDFSIEQWWSVEPRSDDRRSYRARRGSPHEFFLLYYSFESVAADAYLVTVPVLRFV